MPNFAVQIPGELAVRAFSWDVQDRVLMTESELYDHATEGTSAKQVLITEENHLENNDFTRWWEHTLVNRTACDLCENDGISMERALELAERMCGSSVNGAPSSAQENVSAVEDTDDLDGREITVIRGNNVYVGTLKRKPESLVVVMEENKGE